MINHAIFWKTFRDSASLLIAAAVGVILFTMLFVWSMLDMGTELMRFVSQFEFLKKIFEVGFGINVSGEVSLRILFAVCFTHGVILTLSFAVIIANATRVIVGEVERGTADLLLTLPVNRLPRVFPTGIQFLLLANGCWRNLRACVLLSGSSRSCSGCRNWSSVGFSGVEIR